MVYPNPFSSQTTISIDVENIIQTWTLNIYDATGKKVISQNIKNSNKTTIKRDNLSKGVYFYQANDNTQVLGCGNFIITD